MSIRLAGRAASWTTGLALSLLAGILYLKLRPPLFNYDGYLYRLAACLHGWFRADTEAPSTPCLVAAGCAIVSAVLFHQAVVLLVLAGALVLLVYGRDPLRLRIRRSVLWGAAASGAVLAAYLVLSTLARVPPTSLLRWASSYLQTQHPIQVLFPECIAKTAIGMLRSLLQTQQWELFLTEHYSREVILRLYSLIFVLACLGGVVLCSSRSFRTRFRILARHNALFLFCLFSIIAWSVFVIAWEPTAHYWGPILLPLSVCAGFFRQYILAPSGFRIGAENFLQLRSPHGAAEARRAGE